MSVKSRVLSVLEAQKGTYFSGEALAQELEISRAAVWKAIDELRGEGYPIKAAPRRGYQLGSESDLLSAEAVRLSLRTQSDRQIHCHRSVSSTNQELKQLAAAGAAAGTILLAEEQTAGRGRWGRQFASPPGGGIYLSVLLRPRISAAQATTVTAAAAVAVCRAVETLCQQSLGIKWVNDLYLNNKKVCGILTEAATDFETGSLEYLTVGIGINYTTPSTAFPADLREIAGAIFPHGKGTASRCELAAEVINQLEELLPELETGAFLQEYRTRSILLGRWIALETEGKTERVFAEEIDNQARLCIRRADNTTAQLSSAAVSIRRMEE